MKCCVWVPRKKTPEDIFVRYSPFALKTYFNDIFCFNVTAIRDESPRLFCSPTSGRWRWRWYGVSHRANRRSSQRTAARRCPELPPLPPVCRPALSRLARHGVAVETHHRRGSWEVPCLPVNCDSEAAREPPSVIYTRREGRKGPSNRRSFRPPAGIWWEIYIDCNYKWTSTGAHQALISIMGSYSHT